MKKLTRKLIISMLSAAMAFSAMTISASAAVNVPKSVTVYANSSSNISIQGLGTAKNKITKSSIKSSNTNVAQPTALTTNVSTYSYKSEPLTKGGRGYSDSSSSNSQSIELWTNKTGTANVSFKIGSKSYSTKVTVLKYTNPIKSITLTGANGGKSFAGLTKQMSNASVTLSKKTLTKSWLTVVPASGWKIMNVSVSSSRGSDPQYYSFNSNKPASKAVLGVGSVQKGGYINISLLNTKNNASMYIYYDLA